MRNPLDAIPIETIAAIAANFPVSMSPHDATMRAYALLETALAGKPGIMPAPESYRFGIELHQQTVAQVRYYDEMLDAGHDPIQVANRVLEDLPPSWMMAEGKRANTLAR
jgi:hypothetical protein